MKAVFHRYGSIVESDILAAFKEFNIEVIEENIEITQKAIDSDTRIRSLGEAVISNSPDFVFSINYFPYIAQICEKLKVFYICLSVDCPVLEIYSETIRSKYNRIFLFDYAQYESIVNENPEGIYYLPLGTNVDRWDGVLRSENLTYKYDVSLVGSLYTEKSPYRELKLNEETRGFFDGIMRAQARLSGLSLIREVINDRDVSEYVRNIVKAGNAVFERFSIEKPIIDEQLFALSENILGYELSARERIDLLNSIAQKSIDVALFTRSKCNELNPNIRVMGGVSTHNEMPLVFAESKINLNHTMRCIETGLSQRVWDIMGCGGFVLSNYQAEIPEYFEIGKEIACYENTAECIELIKYYLSHDEERNMIAKNGYEKVKSLHTYKIRVAKMIDTVFGGK